MDLLNRYRTTENKKAAYVAAFRLIIILFRTSMDYDLVEGRGIGTPDLDVANVALSQLS